MSKRGVRAIVIRSDRLLVMERNRNGKHYYALIGGTIDQGESPEQALVREVREETGMKLKRYRHVFTENVSPEFGVQYVYLCDDPGGEPILEPTSIEAQLNRQGANLFKPTWLSLDDLPDSPLMSPKMKQAIIDAVKNTFPDSPTTL